MDLELNTAAQQLVDMANSGSSAPKRGRKRKEETAGASDVPKGGVAKGGGSAVSANSADQKTKKTKNPTDTDGGAVDADQKTKKTKKRAKKATDGGAVDADQNPKAKKRAKKATGGGGDGSGDVAAQNPKGATEEKATASAPKKPRRKRAKKEDDGTPKKPRKLCSYMLFVKTVRAEVVAKNPTLKVTEIGKKLGEMWNALSDAEKKAFKQADDVLPVGVGTNSDVVSGDVGGSAVSGDVGGSAVSGDVGGSAVSGDVGVIPSQ